MERSTLSERPNGVRWLVYWCGRLLQALGLLLISVVLLAFTETVGMWPLLYWSAVAALVFYLGWACTVWGKAKR
ncbi:MAG: hypothetical protein AB7N91_28395 [Candidatus Tectimicrobiota bacterium]